MSNLKVNTINDASGGSAAVLYGVASPPNSMGFRNRIINGDMRIDQRNAGASVSLPNVATTFTLDRWRFYRDNASLTVTSQQSTTVPTGFINSLLVTIGTGSAPSNTNELQLAQPIEGFNIADLGFGTASASAVTVSFWVRSSLTGTFAFALQSASSGRSYVATYTINAANTFEYKTVTIPGDTSGTWNSSNGAGLTIVFDLGAGSNFQTSAGSWAAGNRYGTSTSVKLCSTSGATWQITGVQLEAGSVATPFERRDYGRELIMCQRYFEKSYDMGTAPGANTSTGAITASGPQGTATTNEVNAGSVRYKVSKRATPTVTVYDTDGNSGKCTRVLAAVGSNVNQAITVDTPTTNSEGFYAYSSTGLSATGAIIQYTASAEL